MELKEREERALVWCGQSFTSFGRASDILVFIIFVRVVIHHVCKCLVLSCLLCLYFAELSELAGEGFDKFVLNMSCVQVSCLAVKRGIERRTFDCLIFSPGGHIFSSCFLLSVYYRTRGQYYAMGRLRVTARSTNLAIFGPEQLC